MANTKQVAEPALPPPEEFDMGLDIKPPEDRRLVATPEEIAAAEGQADPEDQVTELTDEERTLFRSLLTVGKRSKTISVMDHTVVIETLRVDDELRIGLHCKPFQDTQAFSRSYQLAVCAAGIRSVDGRALYNPLTAEPELDTVFDEKVKVLKSYYPVVVNQIYRQILELEAEFAELAKKLGKLPG